MSDAPPGYESYDDDEREEVDDGLGVESLNLSTDPPGMPGEVGPSTAGGADLYSAETTFEEMGLAKEILRGLYDEMKFTKPSRIQAMTLPKVLGDKETNMIAQGHNGCGKTTCFTLAMISKVEVRIPKPQALCMCPTRELVVQNLSVLRKMAKFTEVTATGTNEIITGRGVPPVSEHVIIGTPGSINRLIEQRRFALDALQILVFDEADEMMKVDGFKDTSVTMINNARRASPSVQILLFSATYDETVKSYCMKVIPGAHRVFIERKEELSLDVIKQYRVEVDSDEQKSEVLKEYIFKNADRLGQTIIFVRTRRAAEMLHSSMQNEGYNCLKLAGDMEDQARDFVVQQFRDVQTKILISTDVIARGFDVSTVTLVINYDLPTEYRTGKPAYDTYLHRIGRSGRFGRKGAAFNFVNVRRHHPKALPDSQVMDDIAEYFQRNIPSVPVHNEDAFITVLEEAGLMEVEKD